MVIFKVVNVFGDGPGGRLRGHFLLWDWLEGGDIFGRDIVGMQALTRIDQAVNQAANEPLLGGDAGFRPPFLEVSGARPRSFDDLVFLPRHQAILIFVLLVLAVPFPHSLKLSACLRVRTHGGVFFGRMRLTRCATRVRAPPNSFCGKMCD